MKFKPKKSQILAIFLSIMLNLAGCTPPIEKKVQLCPGAESLSQAVNSLQNVPRGTQSLKLIGKCLAKFSADGKNYKENFGVKIWVQPPYNIYLQGDIFPNSKGIVLGANRQQFWLCIKPEINSYYWGDWDEAEFSENLIINPAILLEALGNVKIDDTNRWFLNQTEGFDVLVQKNGAGRIIKKVYVYNCDYLIRKIEYFDNEDKVVIRIELNEYKKLSDNLFVPSKICITNIDNHKNKDSFEFIFTSIKNYEFNEKQEKIFFTLPKMKGFKNIVNIKRNF